MTDRKKNVIVIGSGLAGMSAACTAAARGHYVTVLEKNDWVGGKAAQLVAEGYRFDMGPTILTLPSVLARVFAEAGKRLEDYLTLIPLDPQWRCFFDSNESNGAGRRVLDLVADVEQMKMRLSQFARSEKVAAGYQQFITMSQRLHEVSNRFFFWKSIGGLADTMDLKQSFSASVLKDVLALKMGRSVAGVVRSHIDDRQVAQMVDHFTQYVGSSPASSPAVLCGIAHMQTSEGIWYPIGGTKAIAHALHRLAIELGVNVRTGVDVLQVSTRIDRTDGRTVVHGVETAEHETIDCDVVISNCDAIRTYRELLAQAEPSKSKVGKSTLGTRRTEPACSGVVLFLGLNRAYDHLLHHNFVFSNDPHEEFDWIYRRGEPAPDPTAYVCTPSRTDRAVAPHGCEAMYVLVHTPYLRPHHDWKTRLPSYRDIILDKLERTAGLDGLRQSIVYQSALTPEDIHHRYRVLDGAIYGLASHGRFLGAFKPGNRRKDVQGLYLAGGAAHPGPGMPMVLMSGWIAADCMDQDAVVSSSV